MLNRVAVILAFIAASAIFLFTYPVAAAPYAQSTLPNFTLNAQTVISVTVAITDGQVIVVPVDLTFIAQNQDGETDVSLIADVEQQPGIFIGVAPSSMITATIQLPQSATAIPSASSADEANVTGTHVANRNSNRRAGPGTNFEIVGRVPAGGAVTVVGENDDGTWLELEDGSWIAEFLVDPVPNNTTEDEEADEEENADEEPDATATPTPTTPTDAADQGAIETYLIELISIGAETGNAVDTLTDLIENSQPLSAQWRNEVAAQLALLSEALDQYLALTPVPGYEDLHTQVTDVALTCEQAVDYLMGGIENPLAIDPSLATQSVQACAAQASELASDVQTLQ